MFEKYISWHAFIIGFVVGIIYRFYIVPIAYRTVHIYPTPENVNSLVFKDNADTCFKFYTIDTICPAEQAKIKNIPIQI
jgi:hypothetical protein